MSENPLVSICIPTYNGEKYIEKTLQCILNQDYKNLEILICDDCSADNTVEIVKGVEDSRIRLLINEKNKGLGGNWNVLYNEAKGKYVLLLCQDDIIMPGVISEKVEVMEKNPDVSIVTSASDVISETGEVMFSRRHFKRTGKLERRWVQRKLFAGRNIFMEPPNNLLRRSAMLAAGDFDTSLWYAIDWDYWLRILNEGTAYYIDKPMSQFRISYTSATGSNLSGMKKIHEDEKIFMKKYSTGKIMPVDPLLLLIREVKVYGFLLGKIVFMKLYGFKRK